MLLCSDLQVEELMSKYEWIDSERQFFGQPDSAYDFKANNPVEAGRRLAKLQEQKVCVRVCLLCACVRERKK